MTPRTVVLLIIGYMIFSLLHGALSVDRGKETPTQIKNKKIAQTITTLLKLVIFLIIATLYFPIVQDELDNVSSINSISVLTFILFVVQFMDVLADFIKELFSFPALLMSFKDKDSK